MKKNLLLTVFCSFLLSCNTNLDNYVSDLSESDTGQSCGNHITCKMNGQDVVFEKIDGQLIFQGDIVIDEKLLLDDDTRGAGIKLSDSRKWPENFVYYEIDSSIPSASIPTIKEAMKEWQQNSFLVFIPRSAESNYIKFVGSTANNSYIGMTGGSQAINLVNHNNKGTVMHEIGHALGLWHEHSRKDRDRYISINWSNIREEKKHNFDIYNSGMDYGPLDFNSIMLYSSYIYDKTFVYDTSVPVMRKASDGSTFTGQRACLSEGDKYAIQTIYTRVPIYGNSTYIACPADYDGDGKADLSVKNQNGYWFIDYASNGFGKWDEVYIKRGQGAGTPPCPADYDGDGKADLSVKTTMGEWYIDFSKNGFNGWDIYYTKRGDGTGTPACPADYDGDGKADLSVKTDSGEWYIDFSKNGFGGWDCYF